MTYLAGTADVARWLVEDGLVVTLHRRIPRTFPPERMLVCTASARP